MTFDSIPCRTAPAAIPTCLWGTCINATICECQAGYEHDKMIMQYENCGLPRPGFDIYAGFSLASCLIGALINAYVGKDTLKGSLLRRLSISATITNLFFAAMVADLVHHRGLSIQARVYYVIALTAICYAFAYLFLSVLLPVSKISRAMAVKFIPWRRFWLIFIPLFCLVGTTIIFFGAFVFTDPLDYATFNRWISGQALMYTLIVAIAVPAFTSFTDILIKGLEQAVDLANRMDADESTSSPVAVLNKNPTTNTNNTGTTSPPSRKSSTNDADFGAATLQRQLFVKELLAKILFIRKAVLLAGVVLFSFSLVAFVMQLSAGTIPMFWMIFLTGPMGISLFTLEMAFYVRKRREAEKHKSTFIPFIAEFGRQISGGLRRSASRKRISLLGGSSKGSMAEPQANGEGDLASAGQGELYFRYQGLDVPSTVNEEPSQMGGSWADPSNNKDFDSSIKMKVDRAPASDSQVLDQRNNATNASSNDGAVSPQIQTKILQSMREESLKVSA